MKAIKGGKQKEDEFDKTMKQMVQLFKKVKPKNAANKPGIKYSKLLLDLIEPYQIDKGDINELEYLLDMGMCAWNMAVYKQINEMMYNTYRQAIFAEFKNDRESKELVEKMIIDKENKFAPYDVVMEDFEIVFGKDDKAAINVMFKPYEGFIAETIQKGLFDELDDNFSEYDEDEDFDFDVPDYVLSTLNRNAVFVKPKQPYIDWMKKMSPGDEDIVVPESNIYLIKETMTDNAAKNYLKKNFDKIFCSELWAWHTDENDWPQPRTFKLFNAWFDAQISCMVYDMEKGKLKRDDEF
ncbi:MAG: hypothetical protein HYX40_02725 [Sphingobacteriales bacterium]|nr:hypothetical protein [Sphingobacteriales bacterium]